MTDIAQAYARITAELPQTFTIDTDDLIGLSQEVLLAAILMRDFLSAMPPKQLMAMPQDLRNRLMATHYQDTFDGCLPEVIQVAARELVLLDPDIIAARNVDAATGS